MTSVSYSEDLSKLNGSENVVESQPALLHPGNSFSHNEDSLLDMLKALEEMSPMSLADVKRDWEDGFCGCDQNPLDFLFVSCCLPCAICHSFHLLNQGCITGCLVPCPILVLRVHYRSSQKIIGSIFKDCLAGIFCPNLTICQLRRDLLKRKKQISNSSHIYNSFGETNETV